MLPQAEGLFALVKAMPKINPFDMGFMDQFEKAYFPLGAPRRCGRKAEDFAYIVPLKLTVSGDGIKDENTTTEENQTAERASKTDTTDFYVYKYNEVWYLI